MICRIPFLQLQSRCTGSNQHFDKCLHYFQKYIDCLNPSIYRHITQYSNSSNGPQYTSWRWDTQNYRLPLSLHDSPYSEGAVEFASTSHERSPILNYTFTFKTTSVYFKIDGNQCIIVAFTETSIKCIPLLSLGHTQGHINNILKFEFLNETIMAKQMAGQWYSETRLLHSNPSPHPNRQLPATNQPICLPFC